MISVIHESKPKARKDYSCDACQFLFALDYPLDLGLTFTEKKAIVNARINNYSINKGDEYIHQFNTNGSESWTFRAIPEIHAICSKHKIYEP